MRQWQGNCDDISFINSKAPAAPTLSQLNLDPCAVPNFQVCHFVHHCSWLPLSSNHPHRYSKQYMPLIDVCHFSTSPSLRFLFLGPIFRISLLLNPIGPTISVLVRTLIIVPSHLSTILARLLCIISAQPRYWSPPKIAYPISRCVLCLCW